MNNLPVYGTTSVLTPWPYLTLPGTSGVYAAVPDTTPLSFTGDLDVRVKCALDNWTPLGTMNFVAKQGVAGQRSWRFAVIPDGSLRLGTTSDGTNETVAYSSVSTGIGNWATKWLRVTRVAATGVVKFYLSDDGASWSQLGTDSSNTAGALFNNTAGVEIGSELAGTSNNADGKFYRVQVLSGISGTSVLDVDFTNKGNSFTDSLAVNVVTVYGRDDLWAPGPSALIATTQEYWTVAWHLTDEVRAAGMTTKIFVLNSYAANIATIDGIEVLPSFVGENVARTGRPGRTWRSKLPDQRTFGLGMWVRGSDSQGRVPAADARAEFLGNWHTIKQIFGQYSRQLELTRRIWLPGSILELHCLAELSGTMKLSPQGDAAGAFVVDLTMADPFWYGPDESTSPIKPFWQASGRAYPKVYDADYTQFEGAPPGLVYSTSGGRSGRIKVTNKGMVPCPPIITFRGPMTRAIVQNTTNGRTLSITPYPTGAFRSGDVLTVDFGERAVQWNGQDRYFWLDRTSKWFNLEPGDNGLLIKDSSDTALSTGSATVTWKPRYW